MTLRTAFGNKTAQLLGSDPDTLASIMLRELYQDIAARGANPSGLVSRTINGEAQHRLFADGGRRQAKKKQQRKRAAGGETAYLASRRGKITSACTSASMVRGTVV